MDKRFIIFLLSLTLALFVTKTAFQMYYEGSNPQQALARTEKVLPHEKESQKPQEKLPIAIEQDRKEQFYVLENEFQQLVFSSKGGSLVEINLPLKSKKDQKSAVLPIRFDEQIKEQSPANDMFPLRPSLLPSGKTQEPVLGGYYPLLRRSLSIGKKSTAVPPQDYALNISSEYPEISSLFYDVKKFTNNEIVLESKLPYRTITKRFYFPDNQEQAPYCFQLDMTIDGNAKDFWLTSGVPEIEWQAGASGSLVKYRLTTNRAAQVEKIDIPKNTFTLTSVQPDWVCNSNGFFGIILDPLQGTEPGFSIEKTSGAIVPSRLLVIDSDVDRFKSEDLPGCNVLMPLKNNAPKIQFRIFAGPFADTILNQVDTYWKDTAEGISSDYLSLQTFHGWFSFISEPFAKFLFFIMKGCYFVTGSWGLSIILLTVVLRILLYPLNNWSMKSMKQMQIIAPQVKAIQERYKKDPQKAQLEIMTLYKENKVNPLSGCLPLLLQMPFLIGMFDLLKSTYELRGASFIPGWINNLSAPDVLFTWKTPIPFIGNELHLLPIILGAIMYLQQNVMGNLPKDKTTWTEQQRQQRFMGNIMTIFMTVIFYQFPSGLNIYWISSTLLGMVQQWWINRTAGAKVVSY